MFEMVSFHIDAGLKPLSLLIDGPVNDCLPKVWPYIDQVRFQLVDVACELLINMVLKTAPNSVIDRIGRDYYVARGREKWDQLWPGANTRRWHVHDGQLYELAESAQALVCESALVAVATVAAGTLLCE